MPAEAGAVRGAMVVEVASWYIGVREATGNNDGQVVEGMLALCDMPKGASWCGASVYTWYTIAGVQLPGEARRYAWAPTWHPTKRHVLVGESRRVAGASVVCPGDVFGVYNARKKRIAHVGIIARMDGDFAVTIEGNTNNGLSREGDGVYQLRRRASNLTISRWL